jgi:hypothetical protein
MSNMSFFASYNSVPFRVILWPRFSFAAFKFAAMPAWFPEPS